MTLQEFLVHARNFAHLGDAVGSQLEAVAEDQNAVGDQNPNALDMAADRFLRPLMKDLVHVDADNDELIELREEIDQAALPALAPRPLARRHAGDGR